MVVYYEEDDYVWSGSYKVFPPGYWELNRNNKLVGEWFRMRDGEWRLDTLTTLLKVTE